MYVDLDTGTIVCGPIVVVPDDTDFEGMTDAEIIDLAETIGRTVA